jgi:hypothetical protein
LAYEHDVQLLEVAVNDAHEKYVDTLSKNMPTTVEEWKNRLKLYMQPPRKFISKKSNIKPYTISPWSQNKTL